MSEQMQLVWVQNLIGFVKGQFPADETWKSIFVERLSALSAPHVEEETLAAVAVKLTDENIDAAIREWMSSDDRSADGFRRRMRAAIAAALVPLPKPAIEAGDLPARLWNASGELAAHGGFDNHCRTIDEAADILNSLSIEPPITPLLQNPHTPAWRQINSLFERYNSPLPATRLRDELVTILAWARYGEAFAALSLQGGDKL